MVKVQDGVQLYLSAPIFSIYIEELFHWFQKFIYHQLPFLKLALTKGISYVASAAKPLVVSEVNYAARSLQGCVECKLMKMQE